MGELALKLVLSTLATVMIILITIDSYEHNRTVILSIVTVFFSMLIYNLIK